MMTKYEKVSTGLSLLAILLAIILPVVTYYWLDPELRNFRRRAKLQVTHSSPDVWVSSSGKRYVFVPPSGKLEEIAEGLVADNYQVEIVNIGELPGKEIKIVLEENRCGSDDEKHSEDFSFEPIVPYDLTHKGGQAFITLGRPLAPQDRLKMMFKKAPLQIAISTEFGENTLLQPLVFRELCRQIPIQPLPLPEDSKQQ